MQSKGILIFLALLSVLQQFYFVDCTSVQNLQNLLRHPHYAEGHQHSLQHHSQHTTSHPHRHPNGSSAPSIPYYSTGSTYKGRAPSEAPTLPTGTWSRVGAPTSKDFYYKMSGYSSTKTTSAAKSNVIVDPRIPQELNDVREANEHFVRMRSGAFCRWPRPQVVCVKDIYPEKEFLPRCTLLHRCTETAGCCEDDTLQCGPKAMQEVVLHFYVLGDGHMSSDVEKLFFVNHTECECKPKPSPKPTTVAPTTTTSSPVQNHYYPQRDQQNPKCRTCPTPFCVREQEDGRCSCDCFDRQKPCIRIKRGREALEDAERRCVLAGQCNIPECEYGPYDADKGRCPKRPDHLGPRDGEYMRRPLPNHKNPNHRWLYFERD